MGKVKNIGKRLIRRNRAGMLAEVNTTRVPAAYFSNGHWIPTTAVIKLTGTDGKHRQKSLTVL